MNNLEALSNGKQHLIIQDKWGNWWRNENGKMNIVWINDKRKIRKQKIKNLYGSE